MMLNSNRLLEGKHVIITGCLRGIGRKTMEVFARHGASIWACAQYQDVEFESACSQLSKEHDVFVTPIYFDFLDTEAIKTGIKGIFAEKKPIDGLVNVAGLTYNALLQMTSMDKMKECFEVDYFSQILITQLVSKMMIRQKKGAIVSVASIAGLDGNHGQVAYSGCKAALIASTKTMAAELGEYNIRVNAVAPGVIATDMTANLEQAVVDRLLVKAAIKRKGTAEEVANVMLFLISDMSSFITGQTIRIDGGMN